MITPVPDAVPGRLLSAITTSAKVAVITGAADRVVPFARALGNIEGAWHYRELEIREVSCDGSAILVASHGMGGPGAALLAEELIDSGITCIVRVGTCGPLQPFLEPGMAVISAGAVRDDGTSCQYLMPQVPAIPSHDLLAELRVQIEYFEIPYQLGLTHSKDAYYSQAPDRVVTEVSWHDHWHRLRRLGVLGTEGEAAALFAVATVRGVRAAAVLVVGGASAETMRARLVRCAVAAGHAGLAVARRHPAGRIGAHAHGA